MFPLINNLTNRAAQGTLDAPIATTGLVPAAVVAVCQNQGGWMVDLRNQRNLTNDQRNLANGQAEQNNQATRTVI